MAMNRLHSDLDEGDGSIRYILAGEGAGSTFTIDDSTGDIHAIQRLDREVKAQYVLRAQARNRLTDVALEPASEFIVKIQDINDNEPRFPDGPYRASVPEMSKIGTSVIQLTATDADDPTYGLVRVSLADMDRETRENYTVVIQAKDMGGQLGGLAGTTTVNISLSDANDNPPVFDQMDHSGDRVCPVANRTLSDERPRVGGRGLGGGRIRARDRDVGVNAEDDLQHHRRRRPESFDISTDPTNLVGIITIKKGFKLTAQAAN
ncbi:hypothetical protein CRUP_014175 [Coryphaenoides rupestris]|nr:hypothetical protein CRUP_014175 [Coryphaenoides rupestris]